LNVLRFRLKVMQAMSLVTGDEFLLPYNLTIDSDDLFDYIQKIQMDYLPLPLGISNQAYFDDNFGVFFAKIIGLRGFCYSFNMVESEGLFNLDM
jgi:hypothetical protein